MKSSDFVESLHGLRGVAILFVIVSHLANAQLNLVPFLSLGRLGKVGVWLFFVLSSYLLTTQLIRALRKSEWFRAIYSYFVRRVFRIYPLFIVALALHLIRDITLPQLLNHLALLEGVHELWAIPVEFKYYFVVPVIAALAVMAGSAVALSATMGLVALTVWASLSDPGLVFSNDLSLIAKAPPFLLGSAIALWRDRIGPRALPGHVVGLFLLAFFMLAYGFKLGAQGDISAKWSPWLSLGMGVAVCGVVLSSLQDGWLAKLMSANVLVYFGEISFSLYLLHMFIVRVAQKIPYFPGLPLLTMLVCILVAHMSHRMIEVPGMRLGKYLSDIRGKKPAPVAG